MNIVVKLQYDIFCNILDKPPLNMKILDLCSGTGSAMEAGIRAGFDVISVEKDSRQTDWVRQGMPISYLIFVVIYLIVF